MAKFMFVYRGGSDEFEKLSPDEMQQMMQKWNQWIGEGFQKGWLVDAGDALQPEGRVVNARKVVTDGPFVESKEILGGYSIVEAPTIAAVAEAGEGLPGLDHGR